MYKTKERVDTKERLISALETIKEVTILNIDEFSDDNFEIEYCRTLKIKVNNTSYDIVWFHNYCSLISEHVECNFDSITLHQPTYPTIMGSKCKLQLLKDGNIVCVLG